MLSASRSPTSTRRQSTTGFQTFRDDNVARTPAVQPPPPPPPQAAAADWTHLSHFYPSPPEGRLCRDDEDIERDELTLRELCGWTSLLDSPLENSRSRSGDEAFQHKLLVGHPDPRATAKHGHCLHCGRSGGGDGSSSTSRSSSRGSDAMGDQLTVPLSSIAADFDKLSLFDRSTTRSGPHLLSSPSTSSSSPTAVFTHPRFDDAPPTPMTISDELVGCGQRGSARFFDLSLGFDPIARDTSSGCRSTLLTAQPMISNCAVDNSSRATNLNSTLSPTTHDPSTIQAFLNQQHLMEMAAQVARIRYAKSLRSESIALVNPNFMRNGPVLCSLGNQCHSLGCPLVHPRMDLNSTLAPRTRDLLTLQAHFNQRLLEMADQIATIRNATTLRRDDIAAVKPTSSPILCSLGNECHSLGCPLVHPRMDLNNTLSPTTRDLSTLQAHFNQQRLPEVAEQIARIRNATTTVWQARRDDIASAKPTSMKNSPVLCPLRDWCHDHGCPLFHPRIPCRYGAQCKYGKRCMFQHF
ncbi:hypothetical protein DFJ73DRAFT_842840 [Zopfochytrium polystomum]|nr:hypothetical protein DFJ73DRAFT_842840 [Zopfochytrium polystomum]